LLADQNAEIPYSFRSGNRRIMTVLLQGSAIGRSIKGVPIDKLSVVITLILAFVFLHEQFTVKSLIGSILIGAGTLVMVM
jgi:uncharacterized membrane protein